jgi:hypothetical protein
MGFYNDKNSVNNSSSDEDEFKMADDDRMINTRINRPKSKIYRPFVYVQKDVVRVFFLFP